MNCLKLLIPLFSFALCLVPASAASFTELETQARKALGEKQYEAAAKFLTEIMNDESFKIRDRISAARRLAGAYEKLNRPDDTKKVYCKIIEIMEKQASAPGIAPAAAKKIRLDLAWEIAQKCMFDEFMTRADALLGDPELSMSDKMPIIKRKANLLASADRVRESIRLLESAAASEELKPDIRAGLYLECTGTCHRNRFPIEETRALIEKAESVPGISDGAKARIKAAKLRFRDRD